MSQYPPPNGYGHRRGQPQPQQHSYEPPQNYTNPTYVVDFNGMPIQNAYNYNANRIPGLGIGGTVDDNHVDNTPDSHAWMGGNGFGGMLQAMSQNIAVPPAGESSRNPAGHVTSNRSQRPVGPPRPRPGALATHAALNSDIEEGELSEGQFEDLYEPVESVEPTDNVGEVPKPLAAINDSGVVSAADTPETAFYGNDEDEAGANIAKKGDTAVNRERSGSYSPFLSPGESPNDDPSSPEVIDIPQDLRPSASYLAQQCPDIGKQVMPGLQFAPQNLQIEPAKAGSAQQSILQNQGQPSRFKSFEEGRKEGIKAILRMWPLGVRYQQYIQEGFDESVIKSLFNQLNLDIQDSQSNQQNKSSASSPGQTAQQREASKIVPAVLSEDQSAMSSQAKKGEERKDRIARLLAAKAAKPPAQTPPPTQPQPAKVPDKKIIPPSAPAAMSRPNKTWGEKEILLQQKIAALQEAQARKAANGKPRPGPSQVQAQMAGKEKIVSGQTLPEPVPNLGSATLKAGTGPARVPKDSEISQPAPKPVPSIPGLLLSSVPTGPARNQRKRPVASDFVDQPSSSTRSHKRPFGQNRNETSFVIDVSDGSDEEMDMDMESPVEDSSSFPPAGVPSQRGPSIRDFPPLTDTFPQRQFSSPVPSPNTPLGHPILSKKRETELDIKEKEIQEMRRKIAEAEARRKAKQYSGGSQTPDQAGQTPDTKDNEQTSGNDRADGGILQMPTSPKLPKKPESSHHQLHKVERRGRIVSLDLPQIDETLEDKMKRLKNLREEEMRLEAEINTQLAQKKLTEELENFGESSSDDNHQLNGLSSNDPSVVPTPKPGNTSDDQQMSPAAVPNDFEHNEGAGDISMDEDESSMQSSPEQVAYRQPSPRGVTTDSGTKFPGSARHAHQPLLGPAIEAPNLDGAQGDPNLTSAANHGMADVPNGSSADAVLLTDVGPEVDQHADFLRSDDPAPMDLESLSPSLSANPASRDIADDQASPLRASPVASLDQISNVVQPRQEVMEIETENAREVNVQPKHQSEPGAFSPYNSPLRYFHAYRFHPSYSETVAGGLRSLTYSNRINPEKPFCPSELSGKQCPASCEFQHFGAITTPNDQILLELGKADEYNGEQKSRFIQGLRKLLQDIRENNHQDFDSIAREIIQFRSRFLGDKSKVLALEGVTI